MDTETVRIDQIVGFLADYYPGELIRLKAQYPESQQLLEIGMMLGTQEKTRQQIRADAALSYLGRISDARDLAIDRALKSLKRAKMCQFVGDCIVVVSSLSLFVMVGKRYPIIAATASILGLLLPKIAGYLLGGFRGDPGTLLDVYNKLVRCQIEAERLKPELEVCLASEEESVECDKLIQSVNELSGQTRVLLAELGVPVSAAATSAL